MFNAALQNLATFLTNSSKIIMCFGIILFIITFHEFGHFIFAKLFRVKVEAFSVCFGKAIWSRKDKHGTTWKIGWIPLGGYVKIFGFSERECSQPNDNGAFQNSKIWQKFLIVFAGPLFNYILAAVLLCSLFAIQGKPIFTAEISEIMPNSPAKKYGLLPNDVIVKINDSDITTQQDILIFMQNRVKNHVTNNQLDVTVRRQNQLLLVPVILENADSKIGAFFGKVEYVKINLYLAAKQSIVTCLNISRQILHSLIQTFSFHHGAPQLSGIIGVVKYATQTSSYGPEYMVYFTALLSINLGFFNLLPIPALDGGYLFHYILQMLTGGRTLPLRTREIILKVGIVILLMIMLIATKNDIFSLLGF